MKSSDSECCQVPLRPGCLACRFRRSFLYLIRGLICIGSTVEDGVSGSCGCTVKIPSVEYAAKSSHLLRTVLCEIHHIANPSIKFKAPHVPLQRNNICTFHTAPAAQKLLGSGGQKTERPRTRRTKRRRRRTKKDEEGRRRKKKEEEGRRRKKKEEEGRRRKKEEGRRKKEEGRRKKEEGRRKKEEGRRKKQKEEGRNKKKKEERRKKK